MTKNRKGLGMIGAIAAVALLGVTGVALGVGGERRAADRGPDGIPTPELPAMSRQITRSMPMRSA